MAVERSRVQELKNLGKINTLLPKDIYWGIIAESLKGDYSQRQREIILVKLIAKMPLAAIVSFALRTHQLVYLLDSDNMSCANYLMNLGSCSTNGYLYFRRWVVSRGKKVYYNALINADSLASEIVSEWDFLSFESFGYVAYEAFEQETGVQIWDYIDNNSNRKIEIAIEKSNWNPSDPATMKKVCPRIFNFYHFNN